MDITALPSDIFLLIIKHLSSAEMISNRRVSKHFYAAFTEAELCRQRLYQHFPRARELRHADRTARLNWADTFSKVARRYHHLKSGNPARVEKFALGKSFVVPTWARYFPVATWDRHLQFEDKHAPFHYVDPLWTYDHGLLIFPSAKLHQYALYDLSTGILSSIDIEPDHKIIRRIRLNERVLIVEWCEDEAYHQLNENEMVYRHFSTAYDVIRVPLTGQWELKFRLIFPSPLTPPLSD